MKYHLDPKDEGKRITVHFRRAEPRDAASIGQVHVDSWRTTYADLFPREVLDGLSYERFERKWAQHIARQPEEGTIFVADSSLQGVVGFAVGIPNRRGEFSTYQGEVSVIYLLQSVQRQGIGQCLMGHVVEDLMRLGHRGVLLEVAAGNHSACQFYMALGGKILGESTHRVGEKMLPTLIFGWEDSPALASLGKVIVSETTLS